MRLVFMGTPGYVIPVLESLREAPELQVVAVYTPPDRPRGRGRSPEMPPVKEHALVQGLPVCQPATLRAAAAQEQLAGFEPEVIVVAAYGRLLPPPVLDLPTHGCLNLHPSLLPRHRGPAPVVTAILEGEEVTGVSLMRLDEGMDTGPVIARQEVRIPPGATAETLTEDLFRLGAELLLASLPAWVSGGLTAQPQDSTQATVTRKVERSDGQADWGRPAAELERRRRAYTPWPGLYTNWEGRELKLLDVVDLPHPAGIEAPPGLVVCLEQPETPVGVGAGVGILGLRALQLEGRRGMTATEFLRGYPGFIGANL